MVKKARFDQGVQKLGNERGYKNGYEKKIVEFGQKGLKTGKTDLWMKAS